MNFTTLSLDDLKSGWHSIATGFACNYCQATWPSDSLPKQREEHLNLVHGGNRSQLVHLKSRYNTLTPKQQDLLTAFASGIKIKNWLNSCKWQRRPFAIKNSPSAKKPNRPNCTSQSMKVSLHRLPQRTS